MLTKTKNWIKDKWKRFKKAIIATGIIGGIAYAAVGGLNGEGIVIYRDVDELTPEQRREVYIAPVRNFSGIQHEYLRRQIDWKYNEAHDALSSAYYEGKNFVWKSQDYGILDKDTFDELQAMLWARYEIMFDIENQKQPANKKIPQNEYNEICIKWDNSAEDRVCKKTEKKSDKAQQKIDEYQSQGINIDL